MSSYIIAGSSEKEDTSEVLSDYIIVRKYGQPHQTVLPRHLIQNRS